MDATYKTFNQLVGVMKTWISGRSGPSDVSRDFWMPDQSCLVCYECDSQFTLFNRRHHCRLCGRVFCGKCTANSVPAVSCGNLRVVPEEETERIRACNFCYKQRQRVPAASDNGIQALNSGLSASPSALSLASSQSSGTVNSSVNTLGSTPYSSGTYQLPQRDSDMSSQASSMVEANVRGEGDAEPGRSNDLVRHTGDQSSAQYGISMKRVEDDEYAYDSFQMDSEVTHYSSVNSFSSQLEFDATNDDGLHSKEHPYIDNMESGSSSPLQHRHFDPQDDCETSTSLYASAEVGSEPVDFENNGLLWLPPDPEDEQDEREGDLYDDDDEYGNATGEWGYGQNSSSFGSEESSSRDREGEEQKSTITNVVDGHFRALVAQLLQVENLLISSDEEESESWLDIVTQLSWEAATLLKPDTSKSGGMDPGGYVKVKCIGSGHRSESMVVRGVVCKKNVAHRRMTTKIVKPRIMILSGALEYQRVTNHLSSFDTLLQQEMDHLKMTVAKIDAHNPDVLLVEKSVSRNAQEYLLAKDISLVLNVKKPLLERVSRCTGSPIIHSVDNISSLKLGQCERFRVEKCLEDLGSAGQGGKKLVKTLMYFEGCPKPLGCTILLRGASGDELKKVKHVVQYGVFAAYHLALETSFLADEGAALPENPLNSPLPVGIPDKLKSMDNSISSVLNAARKSKGSNEPPRANSVPASEISSFITTKESCSRYTSLPANTSLNSIPVAEKGVSDEPCAYLPASDDLPLAGNDLTFNDVGSFDAPEQSLVTTSLDASSSQQENGAINVEEPTALQEQPEVLRETFPPSPSDHQSILVSLSSRCIWKGTVCERSNLFRIKYYGSFDKPLGRFLRDNLFDQSYQCHNCEMPAEAHVQCYTHRQGTLTISVKKLPEILLSGEKDGKIWMWHRCLRCPRINGFPPATRRIIMSDAAWGLSFGKFLELSFSNHAAASRVASCGHSLHRDCLRFYGYGKMVACFRYASIDVLSVHLPPSKLGFNCENQEWIQKEADKVVDRVELLFSEALNALSQISEKRSSTGARTLESRRQIAELEAILQKEKQEFEESLMKALNNEATSSCQPSIDILEINRLRRQLLFQSYAWDQRLIFAASLDNHVSQDPLSRSVSEPEEKSVDTGDHKFEINVTMKTGKGYNSFDSFLSDDRSDKSFEFPVVYNNTDDQSKAHHEDLSFDQSESSDPKASVRRIHSEGEFTMMTKLSDSFNTAWTGENALSDPAIEDFSAASVIPEKVNTDHAEYLNDLRAVSSFSNLPSTRGSEDMEDSFSWMSMPFLNLYRSLNKSLFSNSQKLDKLGSYNPVYVSAFRESEVQGGPRLLLPFGVNDPIIPVYDDEPTSIISYALNSAQYHLQVGDNEERGSESLFSSFSDSLNFQSFHSSDDTMSESYKSFGSIDESLLSLSGSRSLDPLSYTKALHARVSFGEDGPLGKVKYSVTCYYAKRFEELRKICCPSELDYVRSLSRCKKWGAQGGKSNVFFAKSLDDRFVIKQVTKTELESFIKFAPEYFKYLSESISTKSPTCLAKVLGIYQVTSRHLKGGRETKMDVLVMENLLFGRNVTRLYDLKGSARSRYNPDANGRNKVLLDQNLIEAMPTSPIFLGTKAKRSLERAVWNDTAFLASVDVMDYSLLVGLDEDNHQLVLGIIDFMRQYTWDKHLETWVKTTGILGGPKNAAPTVISPIQYKKRFRKAMTTYFLMVPDQWFPSSMPRSQSQTDLFEENSQGGTSVE